VNISPALTSATFDSEDTLTGVVRRVVVPSPSWPKLLSPQHFAAPVVSLAHV